MNSRSPETSGEILPSAAALAWAIEMARGMHAEIVAVFGLDVPVDLSLGFAPISAAMYQPKWRATLKRMLEDEWTAPLKESGLPQRVMSQVPAAALLQNRRRRRSLRHGRISSAAFTVGSANGRPWATPEASPMRIP